MNILNIEQFKKDLNINKKIFLLNEDVIEEFHIDEDENTLHLGVVNEPVYGDGIVDFDFDLSLLESYEFDQKNSTIMYLKFVKSHMVELDLEEIKITFRN